MTDAVGAVALRRIHAPFGKRVFDSGSAFVEAKDYIGQRLDEEIGLLYLNARYYDPVLGRFISADPSNPLEPGAGVNRYAYGLNNPVAYSDPYGLVAAGVGKEEEAMKGTNMKIGDPTMGMTEWEYQKFERKTRSLREYWAERCRTNPRVGQRAGCPDICATVRRGTPDFGPIGGGGA